MFLGRYRGVWRTVFKLSIFLYCFEAYTALSCPWRGPLSIFLYCFFTIKQEAPTASYSFNFSLLFPFILYRLYFSFNFSLLFRERTKQGIAKARASFQFFSIVSELIPGHVEQQLNVIFQFFSIVSTKTPTALNLLARETFQFFSIVSILTRGKFRVRM